MTVKWIDNSFTSLRKQPTFGDATTDFAKWRLRNERRISILMTRHYPDLGSTSDWSYRVGNLNQLIRSTTAKHQVTSGPGLKQITFRLKTRQALVNQTNGTKNFGCIKGGISYIPWCIASYYVIKLPNARDPISSTGTRQLNNGGKRLVWPIKPSVLLLCRSINDFRFTIPNISLVKSKRVFWPPIIS